MLEIKNTVMEVKNAFDGLISRLGTAGERISALDGRCIKSFQTEMQTEKKEWNDYKKIECLNQKL